MVQEGSGVPDITPDENAAQQPGTPYIPGNDYTDDERQMIDSVLAEGMDPAQAKASVEAAVVDEVSKAIRRFEVRGFPRTAAYVRFLYDRKVKAVIDSEGNY